MFESTYIYKYVWSSDIFSMYLVGACTLEEWQLLLLHMDYLTYPSHILSLHGKKKCYIFRGGCTLHITVCSMHTDDNNVQLMMFNHRSKSMNGSFSFYNQLQMRVSGYVCTCINANYSYLIMRSQLLTCSRIIGTQPAIQLYIHTYVYTYELYSYILTICI